MNLDTFSVGAIAGLAVAIVFTWRIYSSAPQRRQPNIGSGSGATIQPNAALVPPGASASSVDSRAQNVVDEFFQPVKPTLAQIVRQKLCEGRKVTCGLVGIVLEETTSEELQKNATVKSSVLEVLLEITKFCDLYLMERVVDDESEKKVLSALEQAGIFTSGGLVKDKVLFCSTENGRTSFVRQLEPDWHIDTNPEIVSQLARFIKYQLHVYPSRPDKMPPNVFSSPSLEHFFASPILTVDAKICRYERLVSEHQYVSGYWQRISIIIWCLVSAACAAVAGIIVDKLGICFTGAELLVNVA